MIEDLKLVKQGGAGELKCHYDLRQVDIEVKTSERREN
jgi:hypothetical protein